MIMLTPAPLAMGAQNSTYVVVVEEGWRMMTGMEEPVHCAHHGGGGAHERDAERAQRGEGRGSAQLGAELCEVQEA